MCRTCLDPDLIKANFKNTWDHYNLNTDWVVEVKELLIFDNGIVVGFLKIFYLFREGERKEKERERNTDVKEKHWLVTSQKHPN